jgi:hypothetical protein
MWKHPTRLLVLLPALAVVTSLAGCSGSDVVGPEGLQGTYDLVSVNGQDLPAVLEEDEWETGTVAFVVSQGSLTITPTSDEGGNYAVSLTIQLTLDGDVLEEFSENSGGTYTVAGNAITFADEAGDITGVVTGDRITVTFPESEFGEITLVFEK